MLDSKALTRLVVGIILLILTGPLVLPQIDWDTADMVWLAIWGGVAGLLAYPVAALWHRLTANR
ncbi:hypothetical protein [Streptomyces sp. BK79]|uniref:hypothetical protein n=1 Tax=Streptomyces sp. BK79 TaxID=3350097 RepID=UPI00376FD5D2